jgi:hypothetical protein
MVHWQHRFLEVSNHPNAANSYPSSLYPQVRGTGPIETARLFLGVFEKVYRLTPFSADAQPAIRGKCPLELAGYDIRRLPVATLWNGLSIEWPVEGRQIDVPIR